VGLAIADCQLPISDWRWRCSQLAIGNQKSKIRRPTRYRDVVLTSWDRGFLLFLSSFLIFLSSFKTDNRQKNFHRDALFEQLLGESVD
jgi:hypothetical protein